MSSELLDENIHCSGATSSKSVFKNHHDNNSVSSAQLKWAIRLLLAYFGARLLFFALNITSFAPPDEVTHAGLCKIFSTVFLLPVNSSQTYEFGLVTNIPWLYYWTMGKLLHLNLFGISDLVFLRLLNIPLAFGTVFFVRKTLLLQTNHLITQLLLIVVITNTAMFSLLSASVSYDNLTNLLAAMSIYYLAAFFKERSERLLVASILCQLAGCLTKVTFLPLVLVMGALLLIHEIKNMTHLPATAKKIFRSADLRTWLSALMVLVALGLNLNLYIGNYLRYETLNPGMAEVLPENVMQYRVGARDTIFKLYTQNKISYMDALGLTGNIKHAGDKSDTFYLLMNYEKLKRNPQLWMGPLQYTKVWIENIVSTIFGIKGHLPMYKDFRYLIPIYLLMALSLVGIVVRWRPRQQGRLPSYLAAIACFYAGYLMYKINYNAYLYYGVPGFTLQGRYLFPVLGPIYVLSCYYLLSLFHSEKIRLALTLVTALLFIGYDFPWFLAHATPNWYEWMPR